ncbi:MAG TPA: amino acid adenylation domain-containing protein, partial [Lachnospiraceae bacterium]|nr:amino acid adenylation domain-containing protein [Lachnospiraceae bacterium]
MSYVNNLCDILVNASSNHTGIVHINDGSDDNFLSYKQIYDRARGVLHHLREQGITRENEVILQIDDNENFIYVFWACILGGIIPIPLHVGVNQEQRNQLYNIFTALRKPKIVTTHKLNAIMMECVDPDLFIDTQQVNSSKLLEKLRDNLTRNTILVEDIFKLANYDNDIIKNTSIYDTLIKLRDDDTSDQLRDDDTLSQPEYDNIENPPSYCGENSNQCIYEDIYEPQPDDIAYIQYSSGSTGCPKGITITHKNVLANVKAIANRVHIDGKDSIQNWLPITHSFALVVSHITSMYVGINQYQMPTVLFLKEPSLWFSKANQYRNTILISPNFGFHHFLGYTDKNSTYNWDLSCIKIIATGGEPIDSSICHEFENYLSGYGLHGNTIWPSYGMTEATVAIAAPRLGNPYRVFELDRDSLGYGDKVKEIKGSTLKNGMMVVSVGYPYEGCFIRICNQNEEVVDDKCIGSIQIKGSNVTNGYYNNDHENEDAFTKDGWLKTGDIGFLYEGELVVTGREKDIIFVNGQNYYPIDIERIVKDLKELAHSEVAACGIFNKEKQKEEIVIFVLTKESIETFTTKAISIKNYVNNCTGLEIRDVIPVECLAKASSGKIQRYKLAEQYLDGSFLDKVQSLSKAAIEKTKQQIKEPRNRTDEKLVHIWSYVLKVDRIGINQSFFELGGDSLKGAFVMQLINKEFQLDISLQDMFRYITIERMSEYITNREAVAFHDIMPVEKREYYPLSSAQKRLYALHELHKDGIAYNNTQVIIIEGHIEVERVKETFTELIARHEALRTSFILHDDDIVQQIHDKVEDSFTYMEAHDTDIENLIEQFVVPFELQKAPLLRVCLFKTNDCKYYLILDIHHIISDGISISIIMKEFLQLYRKVDIPTPKLSYKDYAVWQDDSKDSEQIKEQKEYWIKQFSDPIPLLNIPTDYKRPSKQLFEGDSVPFVIDTELSRRLKCLSRDTNTTLYMVLMSAFALFLHKYSNQDEVVVGTVTSGRNLCSLNDVVGMFVNTVAIRSHIDTKESFTNYLQRIKEKSLEAFDHSEYQFEQLVEDLNMERDLSRNPIFDVMFVMENMEIPNISNEDFTWKLYDYMPKGSKMDLTLKAQERDGEIYCLLQFNTSLYKLKTMERLIQYYSMILTAIVEYSSRKISTIDMLPYEERRMIVDQFNATKVNRDCNLTTYELFQRQVEKAPNRIAVVSGQDKLTYEELNQKANALARTLRDKGVKVDDIVGLLVERSIYMAIGILAIMKAGGSYLPIDTEYPRDRIEYLLEDSKASILLLQKEIQAKVPYQYHGQMLTVDDASSYSKDTSDLKPISTANNIAYVIYTSGSTGQPKGVAIEHHSLVNYVTWFWHKVDLTENDKTVLLSSYAFDLSYTSLFTSLLCGGELHILSKEEYIDTDRLINYIKCNGITYLKMTPSLLSMLVNAHRFQALDMCGTVRLIVLGGEPINVTMIEKYHKMYPSTHFMNHYGPTECTIGCIATAIDLSNLEEYRSCPAIGNPIDNMKAYILDRNLLPVAIRQTGEIYIGGPGLARGYIGRDELNRIKFIHNPFSDDEKDRLYRTGDLGRYLEEGRIEFLGRIDNQVKIRGYRVELGEIENSILKYPHIEKAAVIDLDDEYGNKDICAYFVAREELSLYDLRK